MQQIATLEKDSLLAIALASGRSISDGAAEADIQRSTVYRKLEVIRGTLPSILDISETVDVAAKRGGEAGEVRE